MATTLPVRVDLTCDPAAAAAGLERFWAAAPAEERRRLEQDRGLAQALASLLAASEYLGEALMRFPGWLRWLAEERLRPSRAREEWASALAAFTAGLGPEERARGLLRFKRREYLRIAVRDLEGQAGLAETCRELSDLADAVLQQAYVWSWNELVSEWGTPTAGADGVAEMAVIALGKLGGSELNYSSDIDLMFAYSAEGRTRGGRRSMDNGEFFLRLARAVTRDVSGVTGEGCAYRVDLRLRPGGREGELAPSRAALEDYYRRRARDWELQMLVRARGCAGSRVLAAELLAGVHHLVYPKAPEAECLAAGVRAARAAISEQLRQHRASGHRRAEVDVKLDAGGIRDIEFLTQYWQRLHGGGDPWVRSGHTLLALQRLHDNRHIRSQEWQTLAAAYTLLRHAEHRLQLRLGRQTHTLPAQPDQLQALARSLQRAEGAEAGVSECEVLEVVSGRMSAVRALYGHYLGAARPAAPPEDCSATVLPLPLPAADAHTRKQAQRLARSVASWPEGETQWSALPARARALAAAALARSDWMAEVLIRRPQLAAALAMQAPTPPPTPPDLGQAMTALRWWQQGRWLRWLVEEWEQRRTIAASLRAQTELADMTLRAGLELARASLGATPAPPSMAILGLGRLGLGELDLLSDVDVVFVAAPQEREAAARLAARWMEVLTAYTQAGPLYAVDTRLRPGGGEGELVQTPSSLARYFAQRAGHWEAISYLKARLVAGDAATGEAALEAVRGELRRRWADRNGRAELRALRDRIEREGHPGAWGLKTVAGGFYDIDFAISSRWLAAARPGAGPIGLAGWARAAAGGALAPPVAEELAGLAAYLRAADHALRVGTGKAGAAVPATGPALERAWAWLQRIHPEVPAAAAAARDAPARLLAVRARVREIYQDLL
ncbi:MAG: hypothetical protein ACRD04_01230 [Terriglobales bacterium]